MILVETSDLVERARSGDRTAYGALVERYQTKVYALALIHLRNAAEAQELTQEVFVHGLTKLDQLRVPAAFPGWLRQITVRMALNRLTRRGPFRGSGSEDDLLDSAPARGRSPLDEVVNAEARDRLYQGLARLKDSDRAALVAFYIRGHSLKKISRDLEAPIGTIKRRLHVARKRLRTALESAERNGVERFDPRPGRVARQRRELAIA